MTVEMLRTRPPEMKEQYDPNAQVVFYHGDVEAFLEQMPANAVQLVITSPPYNLGKKYETKSSIKTYLDQQEHIIELLYTKITSAGSICWQVGNFVDDGEIFPLDIFFYPIFKKLGMKLRNRIVWHFGHGLHASKRFSGRYETLLWFTKSDRYTFNLDAVRVPSKYPGKRHYKGPNIGKLSGNPSGKNPSDMWSLLLQEWEEGLWDIPNVKSNHPEKTVHPCQFPVELVERCVLALTNEGDSVFDPYAGVGSSVIGAIAHGRKAIASEQDGAYAEIAKQRVRSYYNGTLKLRPLGKPVHQPTGQEKIAQIPEEWQEQDMWQQRLLEKGDNQ